MGRGARARGRRPAAARRPAQRAGALRGLRRGARSSPGGSSTARRRAWKRSEGGSCTRASSPSEATRTRASSSTSRRRSIWRAAPATSGSRPGRASGSGSSTRSCAATAPPRCRISRRPTPSAASAGTRCSRRTPCATWRSPGTRTAAATRRGAASRSPSSCAGPKASSRAWPPACSPSRRWHTSRGGATRPGAARRRARHRGALRRAGVRPPHRVGRGRDRVSVGAVRGAHWNRHPPRRACAERRLGALRPRPLRPERDRAARHAALPLRAAAGGRAHCGRRSARLLRRAAAAGVRAGARRGVRRRCRLRRAGPGRAS